jgi:hypothetical protein
LRHRVRSLNMNSEETQEQRERHARNEAQRRRNMSEEQSCGTSSRRCVSLSTCES